MIAYAITSLRNAVATLLVRRLDDDLVHRLKVRASAHGRSAEAEHRAILEAALRPRMTGQELWDKLARGRKSDLDLDESAREDIESADFG
jgi:plasmid stability protein